MPGTKMMGPQTVFIKKESEAFTYTQFALTDAIKADEVKFGDQVMSAEPVTPYAAHRGVTTDEKRGSLEPVPWSIKHRLIGSGSAGTVIPALITLLENAAGLTKTTRSSQSVVTVVGFAVQGKTVTVSVINKKTGVTTSTALVQGTDFDVGNSATSDEEMATALETAIEAITGVASTVASDAVTAVAETGYWISIASSDDSFATAANASDQVEFKASTANPADTVSMYRYDRDALIGEYLFGCVCKQIMIDFGRSGENPSITHSGDAAGHWEMAATTLGAAIESTDGVSMTIAGVKCIRDGRPEVSHTGLAILAQIESEVVRISVANSTTGVCTIARAQMSTSGATHAISTAVTPYAPDPTWAESGVEIGTRHWTNTKDGSAYKLRALQYTLDTGHVHDPDQSGSEYRSGLHNEQIKGTGSMTYVLDTTKYQLGRDMDARTAFDLKVVAAPAAGSSVEMNLYNCRLSEGLPKDLPVNQVYEASSPFSTYDGDTTLYGQMSIIFY